MSEKKTRTRVNHGCKECRIKHTRCIVEDSVGSCKRCIQVGHDCEWDSQIKFKEVTSITEKITANKKRRFDFTYSPGQTWVKPSNPVTFHTSTIDEAIPEDSASTRSAALPSHDINQPGPVDKGLQYTIEPQHSFHDSAPAERPRLPPIEAALSASADLTVGPHGSGTFPYYNSSVHSRSPLANHISPPNHLSPQHHMSTPPNSFHLREAPAHHALSPSNIAFPTSEPRMSSLFQAESLWPKLTMQEWKLLRHYVDRLAAWVDATDKDRHFGTVVVRRTANYPVLLYAVLAYSSLHISRLEGGNDLSAQEYHNRCLKIMIQTLGDEHDALDENLLAAIVILRGYEEISESDPQTHMQGSTRILNSSAKFASSGGLGEAASWITLRQEIYISLTSNQPIKTNLIPYSRSRALVHEDHDAWANRIVLIFARILAVIFEESIETDWHGFKSEVETWYESKPSSFEPIILPLDKDGPDPHVFPNVWMLDPAQVVGLQNYYMARIVLATFDPRLPGTGFHSFRARKDIEEAILKDLRMVLGLAIHNEIVQSGILQASHILSMCGFCLRDKKEQDAAVEFLRYMKSCTGWRTDHIIENLRSQWI